MLLRELKLVSRYVFKKAHVLTLVAPQFKTLLLDLWDLYQLLL